MKWQMTVLKTTGHDAYGTCKLLDAGEGFAQQVSSGCRARLGKISRRRLRVGQRSTVCRVSLDAAHTACNENLTLQTSQYSHAVGAPLS